MKTCPKCKELNGENSTVCFKCKTSFPGSGREDNYKKKCRKCGAIYNSGAVICDRCGGGLSVYDPSYSSNSSGTSNAEGSKGANMFCSKCGQQNPNSGSFCMKCGHSLQWLPTAPQTQVIPASPVKKAVRAVGHTIGFVGRLIWTLSNWALGLSLIVLVFLGSDVQWWAYIIVLAGAIFLFANGFRCITGRSYWIFF